MRRLFGIVLLIGAGALVWGYWSSLKAFPLPAVKAQAKIVDQMDLPYDSWAMFEPMERGQLFVEVEWAQPDQARVATILVSGEIMENGHVFLSFKEPCRRGKSGWLADASWEFDGTVHSDLACYAKIDAELPVSKDSTGRNSLEDVYANDARRATMTLANIRAEATAVKTPYRYVTWVNRAFASALDLASSGAALLTYPFSRPE